MALNCIFSMNKLPNHKYESFLKYPKTEFMFKRNFVPLKKTSSSSSLWRITASIKNKVYEDESEGIICYQDEHGEIICEGYDEGPSFQRISKSTYQYPISIRDAEITNILLPQTWLQIAKGEQHISDDADEDVSLQKDLNCNGFNSLC